MRRLDLTVGAAALALAVLPLSAQQTTFRGGIDVVKVDVSVSRDLEYFSGLAAANFEIFDNGVKQRITSASFEQVPLEVYLALDLSGSVQGARLAELKRAANALVDGLVPRDKVALITFTSTVTIQQELTSDFKAFKAALAELTAGGNTAFRDAVDKAISLRAPNDSRAIVVVLTDGQDNSSKTKPKEVVDAAERSDVTVYGVMPVDGSATRVGFGQAPRFEIGLLRSLADATGGRVFRAAPNLPLEDVFEMVLDDARSRYVLTFSPEKTTPGLHKLNVKLVGAKGDVVARRSYFVGRPAGQ